jgi:enamine deaminase RidA (YjgF/YER057c/UK114 family)
MERQRDRNGGAESQPAVDGKSPAAELDDGPRDGDAKLVAPSDPVAQTRKCLENLFTLIDHHGFSRDDIHQLTIYVVGPHQNLLDAWVEVTSCFDSNVPPATLLGVTFLGYVDQVVEVDAVIERTPSPS